MLCLLIVLIYTAYVSECYTGFGLPVGGIVQQDADTCLMRIIQCSYKSRTHGAGQGIATYNYTLCRPLNVWQQIVLTKS